MKVINAYSNFIEHLLELENLKVDEEVTEIDISRELLKFDFKVNEIILPIRSNLSPILDMKGTNINSFYVSNPVKIKEIMKKWNVMSSKEQPIKLDFLGSDDKIYSFLLKFDKQNQDIRKESRSMEYVNLVNTILEKDPECKSREIKLKAYSIVLLSRSVGLFEWLKCTDTLQNTIKDKQKDMNIDEMVLWEWLKEKFPTSVGMYDWRKRFIYSYAAWCIAGYIIGIGDRHCNNILIHNKTGEASYLNFDWIFDKGKQLKVPELVPFWLTPNIVDIFGTFNEKWMFSKIWCAVWRAIQGQKENVMMLLSSFIDDPIEDNLINNKGSPSYHIDIINQKISCNRFCEVNIRSSVSMQEIVQKVAFLIRKAKDKENLAKMFGGYEHLL